MVALCGYPLHLQAGGGDRVDDTLQRLDSDIIRGVNADAEVIDYNVITGWGTSGSPAFYSLAVGDEQAQECRMEVGVVRAHVTANDAQGRPRTPFNGARRIADTTLNWMWSVQSEQGIIAWP